MKKICFILLLLAITVSCKKKEDNATKPDPGPTTDPVIAPNTKVLTPEARGSMLVLDYNAFTFKFGSGSDFAKNLKVNDIIVDKGSNAMTYGFLRKVTSIEPDGNNINVLTVQATLAEVIRQGSIHIDGLKLKRSEITQIKLAKGFELANNLKSTDLIGFDIDFDYALGGNENAKLTGSLYFSLDFNFDLDLTLAGVKYFKTSVEVDELAKLGLDVKTGYTHSESVVFAQILFSPYTVFVGIVPVVFVPKVELVMNSNLSVSARIQTLATQNYNREIGIEYKDSDWNLLNSTNPPPSASLQPPSLEGNVNFSVEIGPKASLKLYGIAGPYIDLLLNSGMNASVSPNGFNLNFLLGLESNAGVEIEVIGISLLDYSVQLFSLPLLSYVLNDEPVTTSFSLRKPIEGEKFVIGELIPVQVFTTGVNPVSVAFYVDNVLKGTDDSFPFEYQWMAEGSPGPHVLKAVADYGSSKKDASANVTFQTGGWTKIDMSGVLPEARFLLDEVYFFDENNGIIITTANTAIISGNRYCLKTTDGGFTWKVKAETDDLLLPDRDFHFLNPENGFCINSGHVYQTMDGCGTWNQCFNVYAEVLDMSEEGDLIAAGAGFLYILENGGSGTWESIDMSGQVPMEYINGISFPISNTGYLMGEFDQVTHDEGHFIYKTSDRGVHWEKLNLTINTSEEVKFEQVQFTDDNHGWLIGTVGMQGGFISRTTDGGQTWSTTIKEKAPGSICFIDNYTGYMFEYGNTIKLLYTMDGGVSWIPYEMDNFESGNYFTFDNPKILFVDKAHGWFIQNKTLLRYGVTE
jgi:photosystem II stability/assembly factor-like uncharacterized protein